MTWRDWVHVPWHCPYCLILGFLLGQAVTIATIALCIVLARYGLLVVR